MTPSFPPTPPASPTSPAASAAGAASPSPLHRLVRTGIGLLAGVLLAAAFAFTVNQAVEATTAARLQLERASTAVMQLSLWRQAGGARPAVARGAADADGALDALSNALASRNALIPPAASLSAAISTLEIEWQTARPGLVEVRASGNAGPATVSLALTAALERARAALDTELLELQRLQHLAHLLFAATLLIALAGLLYATWRQAFLPMRDLARVISQLERGHLGARLPARPGETGTLAHRFNGLAERLQSQAGGQVSPPPGTMPEPAARHDHLAALYGFSRFLTDATPETLAAGASARIRAIANADAIALRFCGNGETAFEVLTGANGQFASAAQCLAGSAEALTTLMQDAPLQRIRLDDQAPQALRVCQAAGMQCLIYVPVRSQQRLLAEFALYYQHDVPLDEAREALLRTLASHLASTLDNQHSRALERESAVSAERHFIARELHDSIAQSLGFLKIQIHLLRKAIEKNDADMASFVIAELDAGLANSIADVRELLVHFRTRTDSGEIETAIRETLQKFQNQSGLKASFDTSGESPELAPDVQIQVLHVLQESLSNIRKHAQASQIDIRLERGPVWRLEVRDNGRGFDTGVDKSLFHVGLNIMRERAQMIGATLQVDSAEGDGTTVTLQVPLGSTLRPSVPPAPPASLTTDAAASESGPTATPRALAAQKT